MPFPINPHLPKPQGTTDPSITRDSVRLIRGKQRQGWTWVHPLCAVLGPACFAQRPQGAALPAGHPSTQLRGSPLLEATTTAGSAIPLGMSAWSVSGSACLG